MRCVFLAETALAPPSAGRYGRMVARSVELDADAPRSANDRPLSARTKANSGP